MRKKFLLTGAVVLAIVLAAPAVLFFAPKVPADPGTLEGKYYNLVYALSPCPAATPQKYAEDGVEFEYLSRKDSRDLERPPMLFQEGGVPLHTMLKGYTQTLGHYVGNIDIATLIPGKRRVTDKELADFSVWYAAKFQDGTPEMTYGCVKGAPFSACFKFGQREGFCFTSYSGRLYCLEDQDLGMQCGRFSFLKTLGCSVRGGCLEGYSSYGIRHWFRRPAWEKNADCNFLKIKETLVVKKGIL